MAQGFTKAMARNIFYGGSLFFILVFLGLTFDTNSALPKHDNSANLTETVALGKKLWEKNDCIGCHTLLGEGAYFAPELGNVFFRYGGRDDPEGAKEAIKAWMQAQPSGIEGRRQMPQFNLSEQELNDLADYLEWVSHINTQNWPPNDAG
jgi:nitric oxide reductase subunit C